MDEKVFVNLINTTSRKLDTICFDNLGKPWLCIVLNPGENKRICTYKTYPWIFCDHYTSERMHVYNKNIFRPIIPSNSTLDFDNMIDIHIHLPLRTLKEIAMCEIIKNVSSPSSIDQLQIPSILKTELKSKKINQYGLSQFFTVE